MVGVSMDDFWNMTPHELGLAFKGFKRRLRAYQAIGGWAGAVAASPYSKSGPPKPPFSEVD